MNKILIALGLTLAASTGAFAQSPNDYVELNAPVRGPAAAEYAAIQKMEGIDYTATASFERSKTPSTHTEYSLERFNR